MLALNTPCILSYSLPTTRKSEIFSNCRTFAKKSASTGIRNREAYHFDPLHLAGQPVPRVTVAR